MMKVEVTKSGGGINILKRRINGLIFKANQAAKETGEFVLEESNKLIPVDTHTLKQDGHVRMASTATKVVAVVGYGTYGVKKSVYSYSEDRFVVREPSAYAVYLHEIPDRKHFHGQFEFLKTVRNTRQEEIRKMFNAIIGVP